MEEIAEQQTLLTQQDVKYMVTFIIATLERKWDRYQHEFDEDIEYWYQMEIYIKSMKKNYGKTNSYAYSLLNTNAPTELNIKLEHYRRQLYEGFANLTV